MQKLNNISLNNQLVKEETKRKIRKYLEKNENKNTTYQNLWDSNKRQVYSNKLLYFKFSNNQPNFTPQGARKRTKLAQSQQKEGNNRLKQK